LVDDDPLFLNTTARTLQTEGYECDLAAEGAEARQLLEGKEYDLLISDLQIPGNQEFQLVREAPQIRAGIPTILVTAFPTMESAVASLQLRVTAYLVKPLETKELLAAVEPAVRDHQALRLVRRSLERVDEWKRSLQKIEQVLARHRRGALAPWQTLLDLSLRNAAQAALDAEIFASQVTHESNTHADVEKLNSTRPQVLLNALLETIVVLDKTKTAFKSKDLAELRKKLECLLGPGTRKPSVENSG